MPSRKTLSLVTLLIAVLVLPAIADTITGGQIFVSDFTLTTSLRAPGFVLTGIFDDDFFGNSPHLPTLCSGGCGLSDIEGTARAGMIQFNAGGFIFVNGEPMGYNGFSKVTAVTFHSSLKSNGILTAFGTATASGPFIICMTTDEGCVDTGLVLNFSDKPWHYVAHFTLVDPEAALYAFRDLRITSVPEPASVLLISTGLAAAGLFHRKLRRRSSQ